MSDLMGSAGVRWYLVAFDEMIFEVHSGHLHAKAIGSPKRIDSGGYPWALNMAMIPVKFIVPILAHKSEVVQHFTL